MRNIYSFHINGKVTIMMYVYILTYLGVKKKEQIKDKIKIKNKYQNLV